MQIAETVYTVSESGSLTIPDTVLREMGLGPGNTVRVAYLTQDGQQNTFQDFLLSSSPLDELSEEQQLRVPTHMLEDSNIPVDADLQILCLNGCIVICQDSALSSVELAAVLSRLQAAGELTSSLPADPEQLNELINHFQEGADPSDL